MKAAHVLLLAAAVLPAGCSKDRQEDRAAWPPRTHKNDELAAGVPAGAKLSLRVPAEGKIRYGGVQRGSPDGFLPDPVNFHVSAGVLVSKLGAIERKAEIKGWVYVYEDAAKSQAAAWGVKVVRGEVIVSNVFLRPAPADRCVENAFEAEDLGQAHTLIRLDPSKGHQLCLLFRGDGGGGGRTKVLNDAELWGRCSESEDADARSFPLVSTAAYVGTEVRLGGRTYHRRADGWYADGRRAGGR